MNQEVKKRWVEALRSGKYGQTTGLLRDSGNAFCCLGVLCEVVKNDIGLKTSGNCYGEADEQGDLPQEVMAYADLSTNAVDIPELERSLVYFNDTAGKSFNEIADIIEEYL